MGASDSTTPWVECITRFAGDHPTQPGHFPDYPLIPGAVLLEEILSAIRQSEPLSYPLEVIQVKFMQPVRPDHSVTIRWCAQALDQFKFELYLHGTPTPAVAGTLRSRP